MSALASNREGLRSLVILGFYPKQHFVVLNMATCVLIEVTVLLYADEASHLISVNILLFQICREVEDSIEKIPETWDLTLLYYLATRIPSTHPAHPPLTCYSSLVPNTPPSNPSLDPLQFAQPSCRALGPRRRGCRIQAPFALLISCGDCRVRVKRCWLGRKRAVDGVAWTGVCKDMGSEDELLEVSFGLRCG